MEPDPNRTIKEGNYTLTFKGTKQKVQVLNTMQGQWPSTKEILMVHFSPEHPRFPIPVSTLEQWGAHSLPA
jgi:hypothetical protein